MHFELGVLSEKIARLRIVGDHLSKKMAMKQDFLIEIKEIYLLISEIHSCMSGIKEEIKQCPILAQNNKSS